MRTPDIIPVFVGYDPGEPVAFHACVESIIKHASRPVQITPVALNTMRGLYQEQHKDGSNEFIYSRFLIPWLCSWMGHAIWLDGDMLLRDDIAKLWDMRRSDTGVQVVKHDYRTKYPIKYRGAKNEDYPCKNWSSVILWYCAFSAHRKLTPDYVATAAGAELHRFLWLTPERIGSLPPEWNHLCMEYLPRNDAKLAHFTVGTPCFEGYEQQEHAEEWHHTVVEMNQPAKGFVRSSYGS